MCPSPRILSALLFFSLPLAVATPASAAPECTKGAGPALSEIACEIARALGDRAKRALAAPLPLPASLQRQALGLGLAPALLLAVTGQLSKSFVMQHVHPSFRCLVERAR